MQKTILLCSILCLFVSNASAYCWGAGQNPGFSAPPKVEQISLDKVRVSWAGIVTKRHCTDNFVVKYWPRSAPSQYKVTDLVAKDLDYVDIEVTPKIPYQFQAVAREDKGLVGGVDWNKSPTVDFKTSSAHVVTQYEINKVQQKTESKLQDPLDYTDPDPSPSGPLLAPESSRATILGLSIEIFVVVVVVVLIVLLIVVGLVYKCFAKKSTLEDDDDEDDEDEDEESEGLSPEKNVV